MCWVYVLVIYPLYTAWFAAHASILTENLSYVGNLEGMHLHFMLWGTLTILALLPGVRLCIEYSLFKKRHRLLTSIAAILLVCAVTLPYLPRQFPFFSFLHIVLSFAAPLSLIGAVLLIYMDLAMLYPKLMGKILAVFGTLCIVALGIYLKYGSVNTLVEIFLSIGLSWLLLISGERIKRFEMTKLSAGESENQV